MSNRIESNRIELSNILCILPSIIRITKNNECILGVEYCYICDERKFWIGIFKSYLLFVYYNIPYSHVVIMLSISLFYFPSLQK
jgi:hypothetical protein